jgi:DNA-binding SARP family transcriptional activator
VTSNSTDGCVHVLGEITCAGPNDQPIHLPGSRTKELVAALMLDAGKPIARDRLCGMIWPETAEGNGRKALNTELWRLRGAIKQVGGDTASWLETTATSGRLRDDTGLRLDLPKFRIEGSDVLVGQPDKLVSTLTIYQGDFARDLDAEWILEERRNIRREYINLLRRIVEAWRIARQFREAIEFAQRLVSEEPFDEDAHQRLIFVQIQSGDHGAAVRHFEEVEKTWRTELGVVPSPKTRSLMDLCDTQDTARQFSFEHINNSAFSIMRRKVSMIRDNAKTILSQVETLEDDLRAIQKSQENGKK